MSRRTSIIQALTAKLNASLIGEAPYRTNLYDNAHAKLKFWDEVDQFPAVYMTPGSEYREYLPSDFAWGFLGVSIKAYCRGETATEDLEVLLEDLERCIDANRVLTYDSANHYETTEILIQSITTDEGLLAPYAVGEINLQVRYAIM
jgi:hypothetical protein